MTTEKKLLGTTPLSGVVEPEAVSFDGTSDYLTRSSNMTGNANSKTFTFSCWIYPTKTTMMVLLGNASRFYFRHDGAAFRFFAYQASPSSSTAFSFSIPGIPINTFSNVLCSIDLANTSNRYVYVNDIAQTVTWSVYNNSLADFSQSAYFIIKDGGAYDGGRLSNFFLDYTYRDLSTTSNRRLFITAEGTPSSTIPSNPILYLPLTDAATAGSNSGTGGDFTVNGVLATAQRGPNQDNCVAMKFDGSNDYIRKNSSLTGTGQTARTMTFSAVLTVPPLANAKSGTMIMFRDNTLGADQSPLLITQSISGFYSLTIRDTTDTNVMNQYNLGTYLGHGQTNHVCFSLDLDDASASKMYVNGIERSNFPSATPSGGFRFNANRLYIGSDTSAGVTTNGSMGEFYWDDGFIDLATENPFWDSDTNRPIPLNTVIENTGTTPLIAMRMPANSAETNLGTGGQFGLVGTPYVGQRGGNEFWARSMNLATSAYVSKTFSTLSTRQFSMVVATQSPNVNTITKIQAGTGDAIVLELTGPPSLKVRDGSTIIGSMDAQGITTSSNTWYIHLLCFDSDSSAGTHWYINGVNAVTSKSVSAGNIGIGGGFYAPIASEPNTQMGFMWFATDYIDFSQEANRNKFVDQLGYPIDLGDDGSEPTGSSPLIYMKFDNTASFGTNLGTGGDFAKTGTITAGSDVLIP